jgi:transposase
MGMLAEHTDHVIGVDTHRDAHAAAAIATGTGIVAAQTSVAADAFGYKRLLRFAARHARGRRVWAIESSGSFGAGLTMFLLARGEWVVEVDRPKRAARRNGAKSDELDAIRAAREALEREHLAQPRARGEREAIRVLLITRRGAIRARTKAINHLKALVVTAREELRHQLRNTPTDALVERCARLRRLPSHPTEHRATVIALRHTARRIRALEAEANDLESEIEQLVKHTVPDLLEEIGVGPISAAQVYCSWSHRGRLRNDGAFAMLGGSAPIPASSGQTIRYRLNRAGDRQLNCALHTIVLTRLKHDPATRAYAARRLAEGKTPREIKRCLKRYLARRLFRLLEATGPHPTASPRPARTRTLGHCS